MNTSEINNIALEICEIIYPYMMHRRDFEDYTILEILDFLHNITGWTRSFSINSTWYLIENGFDWNENVYLLPRDDNTYFTYQYNNQIGLIDQKKKLLTAILKLVKKEYENRIIDDNDF